MLTARPFPDTIFFLRSAEIVKLFDSLPDPSEEDLQAVSDLLGTEYSNESFEYPGTPPEFDEAAAIWAARTVYAVAQLLIYRKHQPEEIPAMLPAYNGKIDASAMLSADLCLRFLPRLIKHAYDLDANDILIPVCETILRTWHYSGLPAMPDFDENWDLSPLENNNTLRLLYTDRIICTKNTRLAANPYIKLQVSAALGNHAAVFWKEFSAL